MGCELYSNITCLSPTESDTKILDIAFVTRKCTQRKTLHNLKSDVFKLPNKKNIGKLFPKYVLFSLDQANFSSDPSQILILQHPIPGASLRPSPSLSNVPLANLNSSSTQSSSCSSSVSLIFPTTFDHTPPSLNIPNHMLNQANQIYCQAVYKS